MTPTPVTLSIGDGANDVAGMRALGAEGGGVFFGSKTWVLFGKVSAHPVAVPKKTGSHKKMYTHPGDHERKFLGNIFRYCDQKTK